MSDKELNFVDSMDETIMGDDNDNILINNCENDGDDVRVTDSYMKIEKMEGKEFVANLDETLVDDNNGFSVKIEKIAGDSVFESNSDGRVTETFMKDEEIERREFETNLDETLVKDDTNFVGKIDKVGGSVEVGLESDIDVRVTDSYMESENIEGKEFVCTMFATLIEDDNDLSGNQENIAGDGGVVSESIYDVNVNEAYMENEKNEGKEFVGTMFATLIEDENNDLSGKFEETAGDDGVVLESDSNVRVTEDEEGEVGFGVSDLVWGKVRSHPWWPGQIFDPSGASEKAKKHSKKDGFLIAYFGDQTFAWNEAEKMKPFKEHFSGMEKQSKTEPFCHAVDCALGEVSRRVELGLTCKCVSSEVYDRIKTQKVVNAGIRKESSKREGGDGNGDFGGGSFEPLDLVRYVEGLAKSPCGGTDRLDFVTGQAQLLAFNCHRGFKELPQFHMFGGLLITEKVSDVSLGKETGVKDGSKKRKKISSDSVSLGKKERIRRERDTKSTVKKGKADTDANDNMMVEEKKDLSLPVTQSKISDIGRRICSVIPSLMDGGNGSILSSGKKRGRPKVVKAENLSPDEILSHLCAAARGPIKGYGSLGSIVSFFSDMRNQFSLEKSEKENYSDKPETEKEGGEELSKVETMGEAVVEGFEDSYWTDRLVVSDTQEQVLFEPETPDENTLNPETPYGNGITCAESDSKVETGDLENMETDDHVNLETGDRVNEKSEEECNPTALVLNFSDIESVPSQTNLNNIFRRYGPLNETGTEVIKKSKRAKVIFKRRSDAETAFSSSGKFSIFGPSLVSYRLHYLPNKQEQVSPAKKRSKKGAKPVEDNDG